MNAYFLHKSRSPGQVTICIKLFQANICIKCSILSGKQIFLFFWKWFLVYCQKRMGATALNMVTLSNFLVWKFDINAQFLQNSWRLAGNSVGTACLHKSSTRNIRQNFGILHNVYWIFWVCPLRWIFWVALSSWRKYFYKWRTP